MSDLTTSTFTYNPISQDVYPSQKDLEEACAEIVRLVVQNQNCPIQLLESEANKQVYTLTNNTEIVNAEAPELAKQNPNKDLFVCVQYDIADPVNTAFLQNQTSFVRKNVVDVLVILIVRIYKTNNVRESVFLSNPVLWTDKQLLASVTEYFKTALTRNFNSNNQSENQILRVTYNGVSYFNNLLQNIVVSETDITDESLAGDNNTLTHNFYVKNLEVKFILNLNNLEN